MGHRSDSVGGFCNPGGLQVPAHAIEQLQPYGIRLHRAHLRRPIAHQIYGQGNQDEIKRAVEQSETRSQPLIQPFPKGKPQITGLVFIVHVHLGIDRQRCDFKSCGDHNENDQGGEQPEQHWIFHAHAHQDRLEEPAQRGRQQRPDQDAYQRKTDANRALPIT